jgi:hypothetical protein
LNGGGYGAGHPFPNPDPSQSPNNLFSDAQSQDLWKTSLVMKMSEQYILNNVLVEGRVCYIFSDKDNYNNGNWNIMELSGGIDGCVITGESHAQP